MQVCGKLICTKLYGGVEAEKLLVVFEILNKSNIWLLPHYAVGYFQWSKVHVQGNVTPIAYHRQLVYVYGK